MEDVEKRLVLAVEDEVRQGLEGAGIFGIAGAVEARLGADGVFEGEVAGAVKRARIADQGDEGFRLDGEKFLFFEDACDEIAGFAVAVFHRVDERERDLAFLEVAEDGLAELFAGGGKVKQVVHQLEGETGIPAIIGEGFFVFFVETTENAAEAGAPAKETGGLIGRKLEGVVLRDINAADLFELEEFAFDHFLGEIDEDVEDMEVTFLQRNLERLHVEPVAGEDAAMVAPAGIGGGAATARVGGVDDVVVDERGAVEKLNDGGEFYGALTIG